MKKIFTLLAITLASTQAYSQFWTYTTYKGAFPVTDMTPATDWTSGWSNFDPQNTNYPATTITVSSDITANTTWSTGQVVLLQNKVYVKNGATLTIQPGVIIRGDMATQGTLIITRGSQIQALGTAANPIVFTSNEAVGFRAEGDWGGLIILGDATNNRPGGVANIEGISPSADTEYGGTDDNDNSGSLHYVRVEFSGIAFQPNSEINGITFGSVGSGTSVHHLQVSYCGDDSYEWFGGTVDAKYLIAFSGVDDDFDTDFGYRGRIQFGLTIRDKDFYDAAGDSNCFESDNDASGSNALPRTSPRFANLTIVGPKRDGLTVLPGGETFEKSFRLRRNTATSCHNSLTTGWEKGLSIESSAAQDNYYGGTADSGYFMNNVLSNYTIGTAKISATSVYYSNWFTTDGNDTTTTIAQINWVNAFPASLNTTPDFRLNVASTVATGANFPTNIFTGGFIGMEDEMLEGFDALTVYPNPAEDMINVEMVAMQNETITYRLIDMTGKVVSTETKNVSSGTNVQRFNTSNLTSGMYFVNVVSGNQNQTVKFMVK